MGIVEDSKELKSRFDIRHDPWTGDWSVVDTKSKHPQQEYFLTKNGAIDYCLEEMGLVEEGNYTRAPDRC